MFISVKPVNFTDEELEHLYNLLSDEFNDLSDALDDGCLYDFRDSEGICKSLNDIKLMMLKISSSGSFT